MSAGSNKADIRRLEDRKDIELARRAKKAGGRARTIVEVRKVLGLKLVKK